MSAKKVHIDGVGEVSLFKRRGTSSVRISLTSAGTVRVTIPAWAPFRVGIEYARSKSEWITAHKQTRNTIFEGMSIGKGHHVHFDPSKNGAIRTRIRENGIFINVPVGVAPENPLVQAAAEKACLRAIRYEAETLLPQRIRFLATQHNFFIRSITIRSLKGRWGSCSQDKDIVLNLYLMQLPWELIDYVLIHELVHTRIMAHGKPFWDEVSKYVVNLPYVRKQMRMRQPTL